MASSSDTIDPPESKVQFEDPASRNPTSRIQLTDVSAGTGIDLVTTCGKLPTSEILEVNGGGLGLIDYDNDGDLDLFIANGATLDDPENGPGSKLYENVGKNVGEKVGGPGLKFRDVTEAAGIDVRRWAMGVAVGDYNGDGFDDLYITCYGPNILLRNNGDGTFANATAEAFGPDIAQGRGRSIPEWSTSAAFGDLDRDGDLDLYVCNYLEFDVNNPPKPATFKGVKVMGGPHGMVPQHDVLYRNNGDGTLTDVTEASGVRGSRPSFGLNLVILDFDNDGWQDICVANDSMPDFLFRNQTGSTTENTEMTDVETSSNSVNAVAKPHGPRFEEIGVKSGIAANIDGGYQASMGLAIADVDSNGYPDKFVTVFSADTNALHLNLDGKFFEDRAQTYGLAMISRPYLGWGCGFFDFDHDGDEDLLLVNGHVYPQATMQMMDSEYEQTPLLFEREGPPTGGGAARSKFVRVPAEVGGAWLNEKHRDRPAAFGDLDNDGDIDIVIGELNGPIRVLRNDAIGPDRSANWLIVELKDARPNSKNHRGLGAKLTVAIANPNRRSAVTESKIQNAQTRWLFTGGGFQSSSAPYAHFAAPTQVVDQGDSVASLEITWPDGFVQRVEGVQFNQRLVITRD